MTECLYFYCKGNFGQGHFYFYSKGPCTDLFNSHLTDYRTSVFQLLNSVGLNLHLCFLNKTEDEPTALKTSIMLQDVSEDTVIKP